jgi:hypothetical protein
MSKNPETDIVNECLYLLNMYPGVIAKRVNTAGVYNEERGAYMKAGNMAARGNADILIRAKGIVIFLEIKTPTGTLNDNQKEFKADCEATQTNYEVARCKQDALNVLRKYHIIGHELEGI